MASQILSKYEGHPTTRKPSAIHCYLLSPLLRNGYSVPSTQLPSRPEVCIRISICDVGVMRSMKKMLSKHLRPTAMPHPQTQLPLLVAYFGGSFFFEDPKLGTEKGFCWRAKLLDIMTYQWHICLVRSSSLYLPFLRNTSCAVEAPREVPQVRSQLPPWLWLTLQSFPVLTLMCPDKLRGRQKRNSRIKKLVIVYCLSPCYRGNIKLHILNSQLSNCKCHRCHRLWCRRPWCHRPCQRRTWNPVTGRQATQSAWTNGPTARNNSGNGAGGLQTSFALGDFRLRRSSRTCQWCFGWSSQRAGPRSVGGHRGHKLQMWRWFWM